MTSRQMTTSAVLFYDSEHRDAVPMGWFERAFRFLSEYGLSPILFTAGGGQFELDDCYVLADPGNGLFKWGEEIPARRSDLLDALREGQIYGLGLDSPRDNALNRSDWRADLSAFSIDGELYLGVDEELVSDPVALLRKACDIAKDLFDVRYGFAYKMELADEPACYASGPGKRPLSEVFEMIRHRREWAKRKKTPDELWSEELREQRRHLTGLFRGAFPANILSESHVRAADLKSQGVGRLTERDNSLWLWELSESEISQAQAMLEARSS